MDHSQFLQSLVDTGLLYEHPRCFTNEVIERWLRDNEWVQDNASPCMWCKHLTECGHGFSEDKCRQNVVAGASCYRQTLANIFMPFLRGALQGRYPPPKDAWNVVHRTGPNRDGMGDAKMVGIMLHELGHTSMQMYAEAAQKNAH